MAITIHSEEDDQRQLQLKVEVSEERVEEAMRQHARKLAKEVRIPGFRQGKVPYSVIVQRFGRELIRAEAVEDMVQDIFQEAVEQEDVLVYGRPSLDDMQLEPLVFTFTVPLEPIVKLGDYRSLRKEIEVVEVGEEAIDEAVEQVRIRHQEIESVDRASEVGDVITIGGTGKLAPRSGQEEGDGAETEGDDDEAGATEGEVLLFDEESMDLLLDSEKVFPGTEFVDNLVGKSAGDECSFSMSFADDYEDEDLAGRTAQFDLRILDVKKRDLPEVDDELAKLAGDYETLDDMRAGLKKRLQEEAEDQAKSDLIDTMVDDLMESAELVYPPVAVDMEIDETVESFKRQVAQSGWDFNDYMTMQGLSEESLREDFRENAETKLRRQLVLRQLIFDEKLRINSEDVEALVDQRIGRFEDNVELQNSMREFYLSGSGFDMISSEVLSDKTYERIKAIYGGTAPDLATLDVDAELEDAEGEEE